VRERAFGEIFEKVLRFEKFFEELLRLPKFFGTTRPPKSRRKISPVGEIFIFLRQILHLCLQHRKFLQNIQILCVRGFPRVISSKE
jgi:hypothetical protein